MSGRSARNIRNFSLELSQDLVLLDIRKSTFQHLTVNWNFNVLQMALKTLHFVQGLSRTPLLFIPRYLTNKFSEHILQTEKLDHPKPGNLDIQKPRFTNRSPAFSRVDLRFACFANAPGFSPTPPHPPKKKQIAPYGN